MQQNNNKIAKKLIVYIILFSSLVTLLITATQLYVEYKGDLNDLNENLAHVKAGYIQSLTNAVWLDDKQQLTAIIKGIKALPDIEYVAVLVDDKLYAFSGNQLSTKVVKEFFSLHYYYNNELLKIGQVSIEADLNGIYNRLIKRLWILLGSNALKTSIVAIFMYFLFNRLVFRRLNKIFDFVKEHDINNLSKRINDNENDEISAVSHALNEMQDHINHSLNELFQLKTTLDLSLDSIAMLHPHTHRFFYTNTAISTLTGYSNKELSTMTLFDLCPELDDNFLEHIAKQTDEDTNHKGKIEINVTHKNGDSISVELILQYLNPKNEEPRFALIAHDISQQKEDEQRLVRSLKAAESANIAKSNFMMSMSHELRTPLNAILGFSQLLELDADSLTPMQNRAVTDIKHGGKHLLKIIEEILDLTSIEADSTNLSFEIVEPTSLLNDCFIFTSSLAEQKNITLENKIITSSLPKIKIDPTRFKQVIINLLTNAIKYNKQNGTVTLDYEQLDNQMIRFKIIDTGYGIKEEEQGNVFTPFSRLGYEGSNIEGTGIGLNITKKLVSLMNGEINFQSQINEGSVFWVDFPYVSETINEGVAVK